MRASALVARRALTQLPLLAAVLAVLVGGATLAGLCSLLLTAARDAATVAAVRAAPAQDVRLTVSFRVTPHGDPTDPASADPHDPAGPVAVASARAAEMLASLGPTTSTWLTSPVLPVRGGAGDARQAGQAYLLAADDVAQAARLVEGRWPQGRDGAAWEAAVPAAAAAGLGARVGDEVLLTGTEDGSDDADGAPDADADADGAPGDDADADADADGAPDADAAVRVRVVGVFEPTGAGTGPWERDLLAGAGHDAAWLAPGEGGVGVPTSGPLVVDPSAFGAVVPVARASLWLAPDLSGATPGALAAARAGIAHVDRDLTRALEGDATTVVAASRLSRTLARAAVQQDVTGTVVLVVGVVGLALAAAALALAGRLLVVRRSALAALLVARGARRSQLVGHAAGEAVVLALVGGALAVPLSLAAYRALLRTPRVADAALADTARADGTLLGACAAAAALLAVVLVLPWLRRRDHARRRTTRARRGAAARSGADLAALALAVLAYLQLRRHLVVTDGGADPVLVAAPVVCLVAGSLVALRVVPLVERFAEVHASRSRRLVLPLAEWQVARRAHSAGVAFLLVLATAATTFGASFAATWDRSQQDQADARVGADVAVVPAAGGLAPARDVAAAAQADPMPVSTLQIGLGADVAGRGPAATLVAFDTRRADAVRARLPGADTWPGVTAGMAPEPVAGLPVDLVAGTGLTLTGRADRDVGMQVVPSFLLEDAWGGRSVLRGEPVPLDGEEHSVVPTSAGPLRDDAVADGPPDGDLALLAVTVAVRVGGAITPQEQTGMVNVSLSLGLPGADRAGAAPWRVRQVETRYPWFDEASADAATPGTLEVAGRVNLAGVWGDPAVVVSPFPSGAVAPLAVTTDVADALSLAPGQPFSVDVSGVRVLGRVAAVVPYVPAAEDGSAILVDAEALARALALEGVLEPLTDRWWVTAADPEATAERLAAAGVGGVQTREAVAATLRAGPLRVGVVAALLVLVVAALVLALAGTGLDTAAALEARAVEVARLQGLGVSRRATLASLLAEHATVTTVVVAVGAAVGAAVARLVGPLLAVSETGQAPVPGALPVWPWPVEGVVLAAVLVGSAAVAAPAAWALVRRAAAEHLRVGDP